MIRSPNRPLLPDRPPRVTPCCTRKLLRSKQLDNTPTTAPKLGIPREDQFVIISEQPAGSLFDLSYTGMSRSENAVIITLLFTAERPLSDKRAVVRAMCDNNVSALGISADDVFIALVPVPKENFSFGRGDLQLAQS